MAPSTTSILFGTGAVAAVAYLIYFDYRRRNNSDFRKKLRKDAKAHQKRQEQAAEAEKKEIRESLKELIRESLVNEPLPTDLKSQEQLFVSEVSRADELANSPEDSQQQQAALRFYRALRVYPSPVDLLTIYEKSLKKTVLEYVHMMILVAPPPGLASVLSSSSSGSVSGLEEVDG